MPLYQTLTYTTTGTKQSLNLDPSIVPFNAAITVALTGTADYKLQYSLTPFTIADASANWLDIPGTAASITTSTSVPLLTPVSRVRMVITAVSGTLVLEINQGFSTN